MLASHCPPERGQREAAEHDQAEAEEETELGQLLAVVDVDHFEVQPERRIHPSDDGEYGDKRHNPENAPPEHLSPPKVRIPFLRVRVF